MSEIEYEHSVDYVKPSAVFNVNQHLALLHLIWGIIHSLAAINLGLVK